MSEAKEMDIKMVHLIGKRAYKKWIFLILAVLLLAAVSIFFLYREQETAYSIIQAIIEELPNYQNEIENWGYQVSVLPKLSLIHI